MRELQHDKYLVTGAAGFIGSHIVEEIVKQGKRVVCIDNMCSGRWENLKPFWDDELCSLFNYSVADLNKIKHIFKDVDIVFNESASKCTVCRDDPKLDLLTNALGAYNVFEASRLAGVKKIIHASTGSVFGGEPKSFYGVSKLAGESYLRAFKEYYPEFNFTSIRYHHVYGPRQESGKNGGVIPIFINQIIKGESVSIHGDGCQQRHFTYVKDVVDFNFQCETKYDCMFVDLAERTSTDINTLHLKLSKIIGTSHPMKHTERKPGDIKQFNISNSEIIQKNDYDKRFVENLRETIRSYI